MNSDKKLLREYISIILNEAGGESGNSGPGGDIQSTPYGISYGAGDELYNIFVAPFTDVFKVAAGKGKEVAVKAQTVGKVVLGAIGSTILPSVRANYEKIFATEKSKIDNLKKQYQPVYDKTWQAFNQDDVKLLAFMYDPFAAGAFLSYFGGKGGLNVAVSALNVVTGGALDGLQQKLNPPAKKSQQPFYAKGGGVDTPMEGRLREDAPTAVPTNAPATVDGNMNLQVSQALQAPAAVRMRTQAQQVVQATLKSLVNTASKILKATSVKELTDALPPETLKDLDTMDPQARTQIESQGLEVAKKATKEFFVKNIQGQLDRAIKAGVPETSDYVKDYRSTIEKIKGM